MDPLQDFEHQMMLSSFSFAAHSLRLLDKAGLLDDQARTIIRSHLELLQEKIEVVPNGDFLLSYLDTLVQILPASKRDGG